MAADEPAGPPPATAKSKSYPGLAIVIRSLRLSFRETGKKPISLSFLRKKSGNHSAFTQSRFVFHHVGCAPERGGTLVQSRAMPRRGGKSDFVSYFCFSVCLKPIGAGSRIRTDDLLITNQLLYQLSYAGIYEGEPSILIHFSRPLYPLFVSLST